MLPLRPIATGLFLVLPIACGGAKGTEPPPIAAPLSPVSERCRAVQRQVAKAEESGQHVPITLIETTATPPAPVPEAALADLLVQAPAGGRTWVLARGGAGKSHTATWLHAKVCEKVPTVRLDATRELSPRLATATAGRPALAQSLLQAMGEPLSADPEQALRRQLGEGKWLLMLDGTDELTATQKRKLEQDLTWLARADVPQPHLVRLERPGAASPSKPAITGRILTLPELTCADVDTAWQRRFPDAQAQAAATAWRDKHGLSRKSKTARTCRYVHLATWRDVETVGDLAADAAQGLDETGTSPTRGDVYAAWLAHRLKNVTPTAAGAIAWLDRIVAMGVIQATEPDLLLTLDRCGMVPPPGSTSAPDACAALIHSEAVRSAGSGTWFLAHQTLADLLLARWLVTKHADCALLNAALTSVGSLEVTAMVAAQPAGRRCLAPIVAATCSEGIPAEEMAAFLDEALPLDTDVGRVADQAQTPCERAVFAALGNR